MFARCSRRIFTVDPKRMNYIITATTCSNKCKTHLREQEHTLTHPLIYCMHLLTTSPEPSSPLNLLRSACQQLLEERQRTPLSRTRKAWQKPQNTKKTMIIIPPIFFTSALARVIIPTAGCTRLHNSELVMALSEFPSRTEKDHGTGDEVKP